MSQVTLITPAGKKVDVHPSSVERKLKAGWKRDDDKPKSVPKIKPEGDK